ncbi:hypothetical protein [Halobaculum roseum]|uniref:DUF2207 domain-containing protein n=1 Tax=Halobaculum roseum TaxID=2175149 RepID=A0ABD5MRF3_9EURY|nr:hypothetical protein [Halobaculum roseum]QZY03669.1 hypothetical protein K6T36_05770 [Halobaculum roseum]
MDRSDEPSWATVLRALYNGERSTVKRSPAKDRKVLRSEQIFDRIDLNQEEVDNAVEYLIDANLIEEGQSRTDPYRLTNRGFEIAHQRAINNRQMNREDQRSQRQHGINRAVAYLTIGLLLVGLFDLFVSGYSNIGTADWQISLMMVLAGVVVLQIIWTVGKEEVLFEEDRKAVNFTTIVSSSVRGLYERLIKNLSKADKDRKEGEGSKEDGKEREKEIHGS